MIKLYDGITDMGDGAFKNCSMVYKAEITRVKGSMKCLKALMEELNQELRITINYDNNKSAVIVFPYYMYEYEENTPGRIINQVTIGSGVHYRECIGGSDINYVQYDRIFNVEKNIDVNESAWKVAYWRLRYPYMLSEESYDMYKTYVHSALEDIAKSMMRAEDYDDLTALLDIAVSERKEVSAIVETARDLGMIKAVGVLLEYEKGRWQQSRKKYEF